MSADALLEAYRTTRFVAYDGDREIVATVGQHAPEMDALLHRLAARSGVFITAWNPRSVVLSAELNAAAAGRLEARIAAEGFRALPHRGISADPAWHPEEGLFVLDIDFDYAVAMATDFGQNAITAVSIDRPAVLLFTPLMGTMEASMTASSTPQPQRFAFSHDKAGGFTGDGLRSYARYRDLGMAGATNGLAVAHVIRFLPPCTAEVRQWHTHDVQFQMVYVLKGWIRVEMDGHPAETMQVGSAWLQPPKIRHRVLDYADDCEVLEVVVPADFKTEMG